ARDRLDCPRRIPPAALTGTDGRATPGPADRGRAVRPGRARRAGLRGFGPLRAGWTAGSGAAAGGAGQPRDRALDRGPTTIDGSQHLALAPAGAARRPGRHSPPRWIAT